MKAGPAQPAAPGRAPAPDSYIPPAGYPQAAQPGVPCETCVGAPATPVLEPVPGGAYGMHMPHRHKTFGSPNLTLSRDHHFLDLFGLSLLCGGEDSEAGTVVLSEGPATDRSYLQAEYLLWWVNRGDIPVLATTAPDPVNPNDPNANFGFLGRPGTSVLLGPGGFGSTARNGFRVRGGTWWENGCGLDASFFFLGNRQNVFEVSSPLYPVIARPFFSPNINPVTGQVLGEYAQTVAGGGTQGTLRVEQNSRLWGADVNLRNCISRTCAGSSEWFIGYRHLNLKEDLLIRETITAGPNDAPLPAGTLIVVQDQFKTHNQFHGAQIGYAASRRFGRLDVSARASVALGVTHQEVEIDGNQRVLQPGQRVPQVFTGGGLLAAGPNIGSFSNDEFSVVPEATLNVGYWLSPTFKLYAGYNFMYWTNVVRPGEQIDRVVDLTFVPNSPPVDFSGVNRPQPTFQQSDFWAQGLQFGMELRW